MITLKPQNNAEVIESAFHYFQVAKERSMSPGFETETCAYLGIDGRHCVISDMLDATDEQRSSLDFAGGLTTISALVSNRLIKLPKDVSERLLSDLQDLHDKGNNWSKVRGFIAWGEFWRIVASHALPMTEDMRAAYRTYRNPLGHGRVRLP